MVSSFFFFFFLFSSTNLSSHRLDIYHSTILLHMVWPYANSECRSEMCCMRLVENAGPKKNRQKLAIWAPSHNFVGLYLRNYGTCRQSDNNLLNSNISLTYPHNLVNFGPLAAEIVSLVWGTPGNFNGFRVLAAALLHGTVVVGVSQTLQR